MLEYIGAGILFLIALVSFILSVRAFMKKGFLLNNAYIYAAKEERKNMNKKPYFRQTAIVFLLIGLIFLLDGFGILFKIDWIIYPVLAVVLITMIYAIASSILIEKKK